MKPAQQMLCTTSLYLVGGCSCQPEVALVNCYDWAKKSICTTPPDCGRLNKYGARLPRNVCIAMIARMQATANALLALIKNRRLRPRWIYGPRSVSMQACALWVRRSSIRCIWRRPTWTARQISIQKRKDSTWTH